jgi:hypothetical protein
VHYSGYLERDSFYNRTPDYMVFLLFGATLMMVRGVKGWERKE